MDSPLCLSLEIIYTRIQPSSDLNPRTRWLWNLGSINPVKHCRTTTMSREAWILSPSPRRQPCLLQLRVQSISEPLGVQIPSRTLPTPANSITPGQCQAGILLTLGSEQLDTFLHRVSTRLVFSPMIPRHTNEISGRRNQTLRTDQAAATGAQTLRSESSHSCDSRTTCTLECGNPFELVVVASSKDMLIGL